MRPLALLVFVCATGCSFTGAPLECVGDDNCPPPQACVAERCTLARAPDAGTRDAGDVGGLDAGDVDAGAADAGVADAGAADAGGVDAGDVDAGGVDAGAVDAGEVDAGPDCTDAPTACEAVACDLAGGFVNGEHDIDLPDGGVVPAFCLEHEGQVWTLLAKNDGDDSGLAFIGLEPMDRTQDWDDFERNDLASFRNLGPGQNAIFAAYGRLPVRELLIGFVSLDAGAGSAPASFVRVAAPNAPVTALSALTTPSQADTDATPWRDALLPLAPIDTLPDLGPMPCLAFALDTGSVRLRFGVVDNCLDPQAYIGIGADGCRDQPSGAGIDNGEPSAGACDRKPGAPNAIVPRAGVLLGR